MDFKKHTWCMFICLCCFGGGLIVPHFFSKCRTLLQACFKESHTDYLTGLPNRRSFYKDVQKLFSRPEVTPLAVVFLDIDHFKTINDIYGHDTGDELLRVLGKQIKLHMRKNDLYARFGGDEFGIVMPNTTIVEAESIISAMKSGFAFESKKVVGRPILFSTGLVPFMEIPAIEKIFEQADAQLLKIKRERPENYKRS